MDQYQVEARSPFSKKLLPGNNHQEQAHDHAAASAHYRALARRLNSEFIQNRGAGRWSWNQFFRNRRLLKEAKRFAKMSDKHRRLAEYHVDQHRMLDNSPTGQEDEYRRDLDNDLANRNAPRREEEEPFDPLIDKVGRGAKRTYDFLKNSAHKIDEHLKKREEEKRKQEQQDNRERVEPTLDNPHPEAPNTPVVPRNEPPASPARNPADNNGDEANGSPPTPPNDAPEQPPVTPTDRPNPHIDTPATPEDASTLKSYESQMDTLEPHLDIIRNRLDAAKAKLGGLKEGTVGYKKAFAAYTDVNNEFTGAASRIAGISRKLKELAPNKYDSHELNTNPDMTYDDHKEVLTGLHAAKAERQKLIDRDLERQQTGNPLQQTEARRALQFDHPPEMERINKGIAHHISRMQDIRGSQPTEAPIRQEGPENPPDAQFMGRATVAQKDGYSDGHPESDLAKAHVGKKVMDGENHEEARDRLLGDVQARVESRDKAKAWAREPIKFPDSMSSEDREGYSQHLNEANEHFRRRALARASLTKVDPKFNKNIQELKKRASEYLPSDIVDKHFDELRRKQNEIVNPNRDNRIKAGQAAAALHDRLAQNINGDPNAPMPRERQPVAPLKEEEAPVKLTAPSKGGAGMAKSPAKPRPVKSIEPIETVSEPGKRPPKSIKPKPMPKPATTRLNPNGDN